MFPNSDGSSNFSLINSQLKYYPFTSSKPILSNMAQDKEANTILEDFVSMLEPALGEMLIGVYLYGSLATGDFNESQSDIDLLIVIRNIIDGKTLDLLTSFHKSFNEKHPEWQKRIDVAYVEKNALWAFQTKSYKSIISNGNGLLEIVDSPKYYLIDWYKAQETGVPLFGPNVSEVMPHISATEFKQAIHDYLHTNLEKDARESEKRGQQAYVILTGCRSLYAYKFAKHISKTSGAEWAIDQYPQWRNLIQKAVEWSRNKAVDAVVDKDNQEATIKLVDFMVKEAE